MVDKTGTGAPELVEGSALSGIFVGLGGDDTILEFAGHNTAEDAAGEDTPTEQNARTSSSCHRELTL